MSDLRSRFAIQRRVTELIGRKFPQYPLDGLSQGALTAWRNANPYVGAEILAAIQQIAQKLNLLAIRSQDSVEDTKQPLAEVEALVEDLVRILK